MPNATCQQALNQVLTYLEAAETESTALTAAISHLVHCPVCQYNLKFLRTGLELETEDRLSCDMCEAQLPAYLTAIQTGQAAGVRWQTLQRHLLTCPYCAALLATLTELEEDSLPILQADESYPEPDLSFLPSPAQDAETPWRLDSLGRLIVTFSNDLLAGLGPPADYAGPAGGQVKSSTTGRPAYQYVLGEGPDDLMVTIDLEPEPAEPDQYTVIVAVDIPSRGGWPNLAGSAVTLRFDGTEIESQVTDAFGRVVFGGIAGEMLAGLQFEIDPGDSV